MTAFPLPHLPKPRSGRKRRPEQSLHRAVARFLDLALPDDAAWLPLPNGGSRPAIEAAHMKASGEVKAGAPDLQVIYGGRVYGIELKAKGGRLSEAQKDMHSAWKRAGAEIAVCRTLDEVSFFLRWVGVPLRARIS